MFHILDVFFFSGTSYHALQVSLVWPALPAGVKFDPTDLELLQHLQGKSSKPNSVPHTLIDEFIPTIKEKEGICYTHPKKSLVHDSTFELINDLGTNKLSHVME